MFGAMVPTPRRAVVAMRILKRKKVRELQENDKEFRARKQAVKAKEKEVIRREEVVKEREAALILAKPWYSFLACLAPLAKQYSVFDF